MTEINIAGNFNTFTTFTINGKDSGSASVTLLADGNIFTGATLTTEQAGAINFKIYGDQNSVTSGIFSSVASSVVNFNVNSQNTINVIVLSAFDESSNTFNLPTASGASDNSVL